MRIKFMTKNGSPIVVNASYVKYAYNIHYMGENGFTNNGVGLLIKAVTGDSWIVTGIDSAECDKVTDQLLGIGYYDLTHSPHKNIGYFACM